MGLCNIIFINANQYSIYNDLIINFITKNMFFSFLFSFQSPLTTLTFYPRPSGYICHSVGRSVGHKKMSVTKN